MGQSAPAVFKQFKRIRPNPGIKYVAREESHKREAHHADAGSARAFAKSVFVYT